MGLMRHRFAVASLLLWVGVVAACGDDGAAIPTATTAAADTSAAPAPTTTPVAPTPTTTDPSTTSMLGSDLSGSWLSIDESGTAWLFIERVGDGPRFGVTYFDPDSSECDRRDLDAARFRAVGDLIDGVLSLGTGSFWCMQNDKQAFSDITVELTYDAASDTIDDSFAGRAFIRTEFAVVLDPSDYMPQCDAVNDDTECFESLGWEYYGYSDDPAMADDGATHAHAWGGSTVRGQGFGALTYWFTLPSEPEGDLIVGARLSSEFGQSLAPPDWLSDVTVSVNGDDVAKERVIADDGSGRWYEWRLDGSLFWGGVNQLAFHTMNAETGFANGVVVYGEPLVAGGEPGGIIVFYADGVVPDTHSVSSADTAATTAP